MSPPAGTGQHPGSSGWRVVWAAFLIAIFAWGIGFYGPSVYLQTLHAAHGWAISTVSAAITTHFLCSAVLVIRLPEAHQRFGLARVTQVGIVLSALGVLAWANVREPWQLFLAALVSGAGWAATSGAAINAMVAPWFEKDRPKAISLAFNGASVGGLVFTPLWVVLIAQLGFPTAAMLVGMTAVAILWPAAARYLRSIPLPAQSQPGTAATGKGRIDLIRDRQFATMSLAFALGLFAQMGLLTHLVTRLAPEFGPNGAAWAISLATACALAGRMVIGWILTDRNRRAAAAVNFSVQACGTVLLAFGEGVPALLCGCALLGFGVGNLVSLPPLIAQKEFAAVDVARVVALITAINQAVFAFSPAILGALRDLAGSYTMSFAIAACIQVVAALIVIAVRR